MAGVLAQNPVQSAQTPSAAGKNSAVEQIITQVEAKLPPELKDKYQAIVVGGMKILFSDSTHHLLTIATQKVKASGPASVPEGAATIGQGLIAMLYKASNKTLSVPAAFPAAQTLALHVLEFFESNGLPLDNDTIAKTCGLVTAKIMNLFHISPKQFDDAKKGVGATPAGAPPGSDTGTVPSPTMPQTPQPAVGGI